MSEASQVANPNPEVTTDSHVRVAVSAEELLEIARRLASLDKTTLLPEGLDSILSLEDASKWLGMEPKHLSLAARKGVIPAQRVGGKRRPTFRFHPRTILEETRYGGKKLKI